MVGVALCKGNAFAIVKWLLYKCLDYIVYAPLLDREKIFREFRLKYVRLIGKVKSFTCINISKSKKRIAIRNSLQRANAATIPGAEIN